MTCRRFKYLLRTYLVLLLLFLGAKVVFMLCCTDGQPLTLADGLGVLRHGLSLDLSTALYFVALPLLFCMASVWAGVPRWLLRAYAAVVAVALSLAFVADASLYPFWGFKLDASCLQYLSQPQGITQSVSAGYLAVRAVLFVALAVGVYRCLRPLSPLPVGSSLVTMRGSRTVAGSSRSNATLSRIAETVAYMLLMPLLVVGMRGGFSESTTNIGQVYFSPRQFLNHSAVNPVFSFLSSLGHQLGDLSQYDFMADAEARALTAPVYTTESVLADTLLTEQRPRLVVIVLLESAGEQFAHVMPRLQQLKQEGIAFTGCYANSWRTDRGTLSTLSGWPAYPSLSLMKMPQQSRHLPSVARTLGGAGYHTVYLYGGDINFTNMRSYLVATGWQRLLSAGDYSSAEQHTAQWGVRDDITFQTVADTLRQAYASGQRLLLGYSTLSSHEPWDVPDDAVPDVGATDDVERAFAYVDSCLGHFVDAMRQSPLWPQLLLVVTADHGINHGSVSQSTPLEKNHVPMLWAGGAVRQPRTVATLCNQSDMVATLLGQMGLPHADFPFSRDVLSATYVHPTAANNYYNAQWLADSTGHLLYDFDARRAIVSQTSQADSLLRLSEAILQVTHQAAASLGSQ